MTPQNYDPDSLWELHLRLVEGYAKEYDTWPSEDTIYQGVRIGAWLRKQTMLASLGTLGADRTHRLTQVQTMFEATQHRDLIAMTLPPISADPAKRPRPRLGAVRREPPRPAPKRVTPSALPTRKPAPPKPSRPVVSKPAFPQPAPPKPAVPKTPMPQARTAEDVIDILTDVARRDAELAAQEQKVPAPSVEAEPVAVETPPAAAASAWPVTDVPAPDDFAGAAPSVPAVTADIPASVAADAEVSEPVDVSAPDAEPSAETAPDQPDQGEPPMSETAEVPETEERTPFQQRVDAITELWDAEHRLPSETGDIEAGGLKRVSLWLWKVPQYIARGRISGADLDLLESQEWGEGLIDRARTWAKRHNVTDETVLARLGMTVPEPAAEDEPQDVESVDDVASPEPAEEAVVEAEVSAPDVVTGMETESVEAEAEAATVEEDVVSDEALVDADDTPVLDRLLEAADQTSPIDSGGGGKEPVNPFANLETVARRIAAVEVQRVRVTLSFAAEVSASTAQWMVDEFSTMAGGVIVHAHAPISSSDIYRVTVKAEFPSAADSLDCVKGTRLRVVEMES